MAITVAAGTRYSVGGRYQTSTSVTLDSSYPTGGYPITGYQLGLPAGMIDVVDANVAPDSGYTVDYNPATGNLQVFDPLAGHTHTENTAAAYTQNATTGSATPGPAQEVPNGTNLSAVTVTVVAVGR